MDISKLRKKHKESKGKPEPEKAKEQPEEVSEPEDVEEQEELEERLEEELEVEDETHEVEEEKPAPAAVEEEVTAPKPAGPEPGESLPAETEEELAEEELVELVTFLLAEEYYAFRVTGVHEVLRPQYIAKVPRSADFIIGVTSLRGKIIPVMDLRKRLSVPGEANKSGNIVILKGVGKGIIGVLVDKTQDVIKVSESDIKLPPSHLADSEARFIEGVTSKDEKFISVILPDELLNFDASAEGYEKQA
jgi:purine-binding chemotaxis protein CheW